MTFQWDAAQYKTTSNMQATYGHELLNIIRIKETDHVLDAGCGVGNLTLEIADKAKKGFVTGIDSSEAMIEKCIETMRKGDSKNVEFHNVSLTDIPYESQFDVIFSNSVLHWVKEIREALRAFYKALEPLGYLAVQFPLLNPAHPLVCFANQAIDSLKLQRTFETWEFPWYTTTEEDFKTLMTDMGFYHVEVVKKESCFQFHSVSEAYTFFDAVGLKLYLDELPREKTALFISEFNRNIEALWTGESVKLKFERIFALAAKNN